MDLTEAAYILVIAFALAIDALTVAWSVGSVLKTVSHQQVLRLSFSFGFFQFSMLVLGWLGGGNVEKLVGGYDHWIAFGILLVIGCKMIWDSLRSEKRTFANDPTKGISLFALSVATSIDSLAVGFSLALVNVALIYSAIVVGLVAALLTAAGMLAGTCSRKILRFRVGILGGLVLIAIGLRILVSHLLQL
jgi:putative Mn2+ efflux pump MntP